MKYEHTHLSVKVTATGNTAREMSRWSDAARTEYLCDQAVMFLNGRRPDLFVEVVDLKAVELQRVQALHATESDGGGVQVAATYAAPIDNSIPRFDCPPAPQPVDAGGEWPKWGRGNCEIYRFESEGSGVYYAEAGAKGPCEFRRTWTARVVEHGQGEITPTQAAEWLRANGHESVADELEGEDRFEPVGTVPVVGDVIEKAEDGANLSVPIGTQGVVRKIADNCGMRAFTNTHVDGMALCWQPTLDQFADGRSRILKRRPSSA